MILRSSVTLLVLSAGFTTSLVLSNVSGAQSVEPQPIVFQDSLRSTPRLTIQPHKMKIGARTDVAGVIPLTGFPGYYLYVPAQCVGKKRTPLFVLLHGGGRSGEIELKKFRDLADKQGVIVLFANSIKPGVWDVITGYAAKTATVSRETTGLTVKEFREVDIRMLDSAMKVVLSTNAIDPDRLALLGFSNGGSYSFFVGRSNLDIFSRVAPLSGLIGFDGTGPANPKAQFLVSGGVGERNMELQTLKMAQVLRSQGHDVVSQIGLRGHVDHVADEDFVWSWIQNSWKDPSVTKKMAPKPSNDLLTVEMVQKLIDYTKRIQSLPESMTGTGRMENQTQLVVPLGTQWTTVIATDYKAMADKFSYFSNLLGELKVTAAELAKYRMAVLSAGIALRSGMAPKEGEPESPLKLGSNLPFPPLDPSSALYKNIQFLRDNPDLMRTLDSSKFWLNQ